MPLYRIEMFHHVSKITRIIIVAHASAITVYKCAVDSEMSFSSSPTMVPQMSSYFEGLLEEDKRRYKSKIGLINGNDPFGKVVGGVVSRGQTAYFSFDMGAEKNKGLAYYRYMFCAENRQILAIVDWPLIGVDTIQRHSNDT